MRLSIIFVISFNIFCHHSAIGEQRCPMVPKHYEELNCRPLTREGEKCPYSYDCSSFESRDKTKCHYNGQIYDLQKSIHDGTIEESCTIGCACRRDDDDDPIANFQCTHIDCPEFFGYREPKGKKCIRQYEANSCCATQDVCDDDLNKLAKCQFEGKTYYEGEKMETEGSCYSCICAKGFENKPVEVNKHCQKINCLIDLHYATRFYDGCVPIYFERENCCPIDFKCPSSDMRIIKAKNHLNRTITTTATTNAQCKFGNLKFSVGDSLYSDDECVSCTCKMPPHPTCIRSRCY